MGNGVALQAPVMVNTCDWIMHFQHEVWNGQPLDRRVEAAKGRLRDRCHESHRPWAWHGTFGGIGAVHDGVAARATATEELT